MSSPHVPPSSAALPGSAAQPNPVPVPSSAALPGSAAVAHARWIADTRVQADITWRARKKLPAFATPRVPGTIRVRIPVGQRARLRKAVENTPRERSATILPGALELRAGGAMERLAWSAFSSWSVLDEHIVLVGSPVPPTHESPIYVIPLSPFGQAATAVLAHLRATLP